MSLRQISSFSNQIFKKFNLPLITKLKDKTYQLLYLPNSNTFSDWRRTCHVSLVKVSWRPKANKTSWCPRATTTWTFDSHMIRSCTFETAANLFASRVRQKIFFMQSWQLSGFKQELNKKLSSFYVIKAPNLLTRRPTVPWERWEISAKSKIWTNASTNLAKQTLTHCSGNFATTL